MYQRLLVTLMALFISGAVFSQNVFNSGDPVIQYKSTDPTGPTNPPTLPNGVMRKWVHDANEKGTNRITWDVSKFKCYLWNNMDFRLRFPNNYDSTNPAKYPVVIFWHGGGEAGSIHENQDQLFWGSQLFEQRMDAGEWNGFLLFPQENTVGFDDSHYINVNGILDSLAKYCALDIDRAIHMGLSEGGWGSIDYASTFPQRAAACVISNGIKVGNLVTSPPPNVVPNDILNKYLQIPIWVANGGVDGGPDAYESINYCYNVGLAGGNIYQTYYPTQGHGSWTTQWQETDMYNKHILSTYWNNAHKAQPIVYFHNSQFCEGQPISAKMGITGGFNAYEWQMDNGSGFTTIPGATSNIFIATQTGKYRVHFQRSLGSDWSAWTPNPIVISTKACSLDTLFAEHFDERPMLYNSSFNYRDLLSGSTCSGGAPNQNGIFTNGTEVFTQDASGTVGNRFMLNNTTSTPCTYGANEQVWRTYQAVPVTQNTDYTFSFYMGNQSVAPNQPPSNPLAKIIASINGINLVATGVSAVGTGNLSWKKYSYTWNSGSSTFADLALLNGTAQASGNDFAIDEISLTKFKPTAVPGGISTNLLLWSKAGSLPGYDGSPVSVWVNDDVNGNSLAQTSVGSQPVLKNNATDNINFNPIVSYSTASNQSMLVNGGFAGTTAHTAAHAFVVMKSTSLTQNTNMLSEAQASSASVTVGLTNSANITWKAGGSTTLISASVNELNKPILWSFSKDDVNNTANGNKEDIRKNGLVVASTNNTGTFTGNNSSLSMGTFNGSVAEVIYFLDANINAATQNKIESYLAVKYGTTLGNTTTPQSYTASDGTTIWTGNATFQNDVFGIGTDSLSGLVQKKSNSVNSGSGDGTGQSGKGNLVLATNTTLLDKRFLMIGNDAVTLAQRPIALSEAPFALQGAIRVSRTWKAANTGSVGAVDLSFDSTGLGELLGGSLLGNYSLLVDTDGNGDYHDGATVYPATSVSGKKIIFSGVVLNNNALFTVITVKSPNSALPATWLGFTAEAQNGNALLNWKTSDELNVDHYTVEHSLNGTNFAPVNNVTARNMTGVNTYTFTHEALAPGVHYYRISRVDKDGKTEYSVVRTVKIANSGANVQVRPNPVIGANLALAIALQQNSKAQIHIMSMDGKIILQQNTNLVPGLNTVNIDVAVVPAGVYLVRVQLNDEVVTKKFVKQR